MPTCHNQENTKNRLNVSTRLVGALARDLLISMCSQPRFLVNGRPYNLINEWEEKLLDDIIIYCNIHEINE